MLKTHPVQKNTQKIKNRTVSAEQQYAVLFLYAKRITCVKKQKELSVSFSEIDSFSVI